MREESLAIADAIVKSDSKMRQRVARSHPDACSRCGRAMKLEATVDHIELRTCSCGYSSRTSQGHGTAAWADMLHMVRREH